LHPTADQQRAVYRWLLAEGDDVLTGDSFFHLNALGPPLPGLNMCGAGRVVCLIDPLGDVYACPFTIHEQFRAGTVRRPGGFAAVWRESGLFRSLRRPAGAGSCSGCGSYGACQGGCMAAKFFTGLALDDPDPECVHGHGERLLAGVVAGATPRPAADHSRPVRLLARRPDVGR
jgi:mycofactocin radical SAM maturase